MTIVTLYGVSDDLIQVVGDVTEELPANYDEPTEVWVGGSFITFEYSTEGMWIVTNVEPGKYDEISVLRDWESPHEYSDMVLLANVQGFKEPEVYE